MAQTFNSRRLRVMRDIEARFLREHRALARQIAALIMAQAVSSTEPIPNLSRVRELLRAAIWSRILKPYYIGPGDDPFVGADPQSPFASLLFAGVEGSIRIQAERQAALLRQLLRDDDLYRWLVGPRPLLAPLPFNNTLRGWYDPFHRFIGGDGFRLSDRVWRDAIDVRNRVDRLLDYHISRGTAAVDIAEELEGFLTTGSRLTKTATPYGRKGSYAARRLARTEVSAASGRAVVNASIANPFVMGVRWALSLSHKHVDICDQHAAGGPAGDGVYIPENVPQYPPHPHCVTPGQAVETMQGPKAIENIAAGDRVLTHTGRYQRVISAWSNFHNGPVYEIETEEGVFEITGNHPVLTARGWVNADGVELGDQVLYASGRPNALDFTATVAKYTPAPRRQELIAPLIMGRFTSVPTVAIDLNSDLEGRQGEINVEAANPVLSYGLDPSVEQRSQHGDFQLGWVRESEFPVPFEHGHEAGVVAPLNSRYAPSDLRSLGWVELSGEIESLVDFGERLAGELASRSVIPFPCNGNRFTSAARVETNEAQQVPERSVGGREYFSNFDGSKLFVDIEVGQYVSQVPAGLLFDTQPVPFEHVDTVDSGVVGVGSFEGLPANGASVIELHDNLLSSSPDDKWGAGSGNPVVSEVASPAQALRNYIIVTAIRKRHYEGPVYNMHVADDNSYTVNGAAVHNCFCALLPVAVGSARELALQLGAEIRANTAYARSLRGSMNPEFLTSALLRGVEGVAV